jgi:hypothetical protein
MAMDTEMDMDTDMGISEKSCYWISDYSDIVPA